MRHGDKVNNLGRTSSHRKALLSGLACQLIENKKIVTTIAKAKALRPYVEPLITKAKENTTHQRRIIFSRLNDKSAVKELFDSVSPKISGRAGGYTRIIKLGKRVGDNAELALIELVDFNEIYGKGIGETGAPAKKTRRSRGKKSTEKTVEAKVEEAAQVSEETSQEEKKEGKVSVPVEKKDPETEK